MNSPQKAENRNLRILHVLSSLNVGGMEQFVARLAARQKAAGHATSILALKSGGPLRSEAEKAGIEVVELRGSSRVARGLAALWYLRRLQPDIVHGHNTPALRYVRLAKRVCRAKIVLTCHGRGKDDTLPPSPKEWQQMDAVVTVSGAVAQEIGPALPPERLQVIRNGVERAIPARHRDQVRQELGVSEQALVGIIVARIDHLKGHADLLRACGNLRKQGVALTLWIVGDGAERAEMERLAAQQEIREQTRFLGFRNDIPDLLGASDIFLLPSLTEGLPLSLLEAMAQGLPVIATCVGGIPELVTSGEHGLLVPPGNETALAEALAAALRDSEQRAIWGKNGQQRVEREFSFTAMQTEYETLYRKLSQEIR